MVVGIVAQGFRAHPRRGDFGAFLAIWTILDDEADRLLDPHPVVFLGNRSGSLINPSVLPLMHRPRNLILPLRIRHHLLILQHQPLHAPILLGRRKLVVRRRAPQATLFCAIRAVGVFGVLEVKPDFVEALLGYEVLAFRAQVAAVDDGVNEGVRVGAQVAAGFDAADALEAKGVPDAAGGDVGFVDEVEDGVGVALKRSLVGLDTFDMEYKL